MQGHSDLHDQSGLVISNLVGDRSKKNVEIYKGPICRVENIE